MMRSGMLEAARPGRGRRIGTGLRVLGLLALGCSAASATALLYPGRGAPSDTARPAPRLEKISLMPALSSGKEGSRLDAAASSRKADAKSSGVAVPASPPAPAAGVPAGATPSSAAVRQIPLTGGVDPIPPAPPKTLEAAVQPNPAGQPGFAAAAGPAPSSLAQPAGLQAPPTEAALGTSEKTPTTCLAPGLRSVLQEVQARFGPVTLVSTTELHTDNHTKGSVRHKLHGDCQAVDFKVEGDLTAVTAYLRTRSEVAGINTYKNNRVIHIDAAPARTFAQR